MANSSFLFILVVGIVCTFCGQEFVSLGRHAWRCKQRVHGQNKKSHNQENEQSLHNSSFSILTDTARNNNTVKCSCGKICKGNRGLKMHQRSCRIISGLNDELRADLAQNIAQQNESNQDHDIPFIDSDEEIYPCMKTGINLPKTDEQWLTANEYFKMVLHLNSPIKFEDLNSCIQRLNDTIYNYFLNEFGQVKNVFNKELVNKYKHKTTKELKKILKMLKRSKADPMEIKYVSRLLRANLQNKNNTSQDDRPLDHDNFIKKNFWGYVKKEFETKETLLPSFGINDCVLYFKKILSSINPTKVFHIPNWIPNLPHPEIAFNLDPPTYEQITCVIRKMKTSGSPCPLDQLSIICFKRCPYLRTYLAEIIRTVWSSGSVPEEWKQACTILIHKKGKTNDPANFRPITLQSVPLKVFTSCLRNSIFNFLTANSLIEHDIQKGFTPGLSGTLEHTSQMADIINKARTKQRSLVITLLDLKNAFGEVHHNLIQSVLDYHHVPDHIKQLIKSLYTEFKTSIITPDFRTPFISIGRGVLQGDCLSPLIFNLCFNTFIQHIKSEKYRQFGFSFKLLNPLHWFQFADDAAVISSQESENQHLVNRFAIWCQWSSMKIRVDKCCTFGIKKSTTKAIQYLPKLLINGVLVPCVKIGESFRYLGRFFDFDMSNDQHRTEVTSTMNALMSDIDMKPIHPKNKLLLYCRFVLSKISWHLTVADIGKTWITENLDPIVNQYLRRWLDIPISGTLSNTYLPRNKFGLNIIPPSVKFTQCQTVLRKALKSSKCSAINHLWKSSSSNSNIQFDVFQSTKEVLKDFRSIHEDKLTNHLTSQGSFFFNITKYSLSSLHSIWSAAHANLPRNIFNFAIRYINNSLPTRKNLVTWGLSASCECSFCCSSESLIHIVAGCQHYLNRFTWRHDSIVNFIATSLQPKINRSFLYADIDGYKNPSIITGEAHRPDLLIKTNDCLYIVELTVGFESNLTKNVNRKYSKYKTLLTTLHNSFKSVKFVNLSISCLGVFSTECTSFLDMIDELGFEKKYKLYIISKIVNIAIRSTYFIFCKRNKDWENPELMKF